MSLKETEYNGYLKGEHFTEPWKQSFKEKGCRDLSYSFLSIAPYRSYLISKRKKRTSLGVYLKDFFN